MKATALVYSALITQWWENPHLPRKVMHSCLSNFALPRRSWVWIFTKNVKDSLPSQIYIYKTLTICPAEARESSSWGLHRAQLIWQCSWVLLGRYKQMTLPGSWSDKHSAGLLMLGTEKPFPTGKSRASLSPPPSLDLGVDKIFRFCHWVSRAGNTRDHWRFCFLLVVEGTIAKRLRWTFKDGMSLNRQIEEEEHSRQRQWHTKGEREKSLKNWEEPERGGDPTLPNQELLQAH